MGKRFASLISIYFIAALYFLYIAPSGIPQQDIYGYYTVYVSFLVMGFLYIWLFSSKSLDVFETFNMYSLMHIALYTITPMLFIASGDYDCQGTYVMGGCIKGSVLAVAGYLIFCLGYFSTVRTQNYQDLDEIEVDPSEALIILRWAVLGWCVAFGLGLYFMLRDGYSLKYVLSLGSDGVRNDPTQGQAALFLNDLSYCSVGFWIYICCLSKNKFLMCITGFLSFALFYIRGFRFIVIIMIIAIVASYYILKRKKVSIKMALISVVLFVLVIGVMGFARGSVRQGIDTEWSSFNIFDEAEYALMSNLNIYQIYYGLMSMPESHNFLMFSDMLDSLSVWIPRAIWPGKPLAIDAGYIKAIADSVSPYAIYHCAMATPDLGRYYMEFGAFGIVIYSMFWGRVCGKSRKLYQYNSKNIHSVILYCLFMPMLFQMIIRGSNFVSFFKQFIFVLLPPIIMPVLTRVSVSSRSLLNRSRKDDNG